MQKLVAQRGYESGVNDHRQILEAIRENDEQKATRLMDSHVADICRTFARLTEETASLEKAGEKE